MMSIIYCLSLTILFVIVLLVKKSEKKLNLLAWIVINLALLLCYNTFSCYIFTMCNIPITLMTLTIENIIIAIAVGSTIFTKKKVQSYKVEKKDVCAIGLILLVILLISCLQFGFPLNIKYMMTDSAAHYLCAQEFYERDCLLLKAEDILSNKCMMPGAYSSTGILFKIFAPYIGEINLYQIFIVFDLCILALGSIIVYFILKEKIKGNLGYGLSIGITIIYILGYPLNSMLSGYSYLSVGITIISAILLFMQSFEIIENRNLKIATLFLLCVQVFFSYYLFVPAVYGALGIYYIVQFKNKYKKACNLEVFVYVIVTLLIPAIIGFCYQVLPEMTSISNIQTLENIKTEGYIYRNMITNVVLLIPFAIYYFYTQIKKKQVNFLMTFFIVLIGYMLLIWIAMTNNLISTYYFYKLYFILWLVMWILFYEGANKIIENIKIGDIVVKTYMMIYVGLLLVELLTGNVEINKSTNTNENITDVMDIYGINKTLLFRIGVDYTKEELDILKYIQENNLTLENNNTLIIANQRQEFWFWGILKYKFKDNLNYSTKYNDIEKWNKGKYEYLVYFNCSEYYKLYKKVLELEGREVIFENESGAILKNK